MNFKDRPTNMYPLLVTSLTVIGPPSFFYQKLIAMNNGGCIDRKYQIYLF